jgi:DNA-binding MarR family transcriptional regulator
VTVTNRRLLLEAGTTAQLVGRIVDARLEPVGIPGYLLALLTHVRDLAPVSPSVVSRASGMPATTLRDNIQRLVERGLVERVPNPDDGRSYLLVPTEQGTAAAAAAGRALRDAYLELAAAATAFRVRADAGRAERGTRRCHGRNPGDRLRPVSGGHTALPGPRARRGQC